MSGLAANETKLESGAINVLIGEGRTAEVLRNLCFRVASDRYEVWEQLQVHIFNLFGVDLERPEYISERGEITMCYRERSRVRLDLSNSGRGLQQTLLLLAYLYQNQNCVLLLDEPDAHLEILRQRQIYQVLTDVAGQQHSQIIAASHSEVLLNEAAERDVVVAFIGAPHRIDDRGSQVLKSLKNIGFEDYYQAEQTGWVLYLEGATDLRILQEFARRLEHAAARHLELPYVHYVQQRSKAEGHFFGLQEAKNDLVGFALLDRSETEKTKDENTRAHGLSIHRWRRREIENYLCQPETLRAYADHHARESGTGALFEPLVRQAMDACLERLLSPAALEDSDDSSWINVKASDEFLDRLFEQFFKRLGHPNLLNKSNYHELARFVPKDLISAEVNEVLDLICETARSAQPRGEMGS